MALPGKFAMVFENAIFVVVLRVHAESSCRGKNGKTDILSFMVVLTRVQHKKPKTTACG